MNYQVTINIPETVKINKKANILTFLGPLGLTILNLKKLDPHGISYISLSQDVLTLVTNSKKFSKLLTTLIENKIQGTKQGYLIYIRILGVGYRAFLEAQDLYLKIGFNHDIKFSFPNSIFVYCLEPTLIAIFGIDKNQVTQVAAKIKSIKPPSIYKGKGITILNEKVKLKVGKKK